MGFEREDQLFAFIAKEENHIDLNHLTEINETTVACGDPLLDSPASWRIVGGAVYLYKKGYLNEYIARREGKSGVLEGHLACGWMFTQGYQTYESQSGLIVATRERVGELNRIYGASFVVPEPNHTGSAAPFMIGEQSQNHRSY